MNIEQFDDLFVGDPVVIEEKMTALLPEAELREDKSIYLQMLSQIALAQAMQQKIEMAHETLDKAELLLKPKYVLARIRLLLERGRVYHQAGEVDKALPFFMQSYELSKMKNEFDFHTINAAHMIAIAKEDVKEKIEWNELAILLAEKTKDDRPRSWLGSLYNNLAQNYLEEEKYCESLRYFEKCKKHGELLDSAILIRGALWGIGRSLRGLNRLDEALEIQKKLLDAYDQMVKDGLLPAELLPIARGPAYEEISEIYFRKSLMEESKKYALLAYNDMLKDVWMQRMFPERIQRMHDRSKL